MKLRMTPMESGHNLVMSSVCHFDSICVAAPGRMISRDRTYACHRFEDTRLFKGFGTHHCDEKQGRNQNVVAAPVVIERLT
jgi:hypothetical protein